MARPAASAEGLGTCGRGLADFAVAGTLPLGTGVRLIGAVGVIGEGGAPGELTYVGVLAVAAAAPSSRGSGLRG